MRRLPNRPARRVAASKSWGNGSRIEDRRIPGRWLGDEAGGTSTSTCISALATAGMPRLQAGREDADRADADDRRAEGEERAKHRSGDQPPGPQPTERSRPTAGPGDQKDAGAPQKTTSAIAAANGSLARPLHDVPNPRGGQSCRPGAPGPDNERAVGGDRLENLGVAASTRRPAEAPGSGGMHIELDDRQAGGRMGRGPGCSWVPVACAGLAGCGRQRRARRSARSAVDRRRRAGRRGFRPPSAI